MKVACALLVLLIAMQFRGFAEAQVQFSGDCGVNIANVSENATVSVQQGICGDAFKVTYLWLDGQTLALLQSGNLTPTLKELFGTTPMFLNIGISERVNELLKIGSESVSIDQIGGSVPYFSYFNSILSSTAGEEYIDQDLQLSDSNRTLKYYSGDDPILWPDPPAFRDFYVEGLWSQNLNYCFPELDPAEIDDLTNRISDGDISVVSEISQHVTMVSFVGDSELSNYWSNVRTLAEEFDLRGMGVALALSPVDQGLIYLDPEDGSRITARDWGNATPRSLALLDELAKTGLPDDFLMRLGAYIVEECGGEQGISFAAYPRKLRVMVAVIEPVSPSVELTRIRFSADRNEGLRKDFVLQPEQEVALSLPALSAGDSYVFPLRVEFRYELSTMQNAGWSEVLEPPEKGAAVWRLVELAKKKFPELSRPSGLGPNGASRTFAGLASPNFVPPTPVYYFGDILNVDSITTKNFLTGDETTHSVRPAPRVALFTTRGFDGASCPFLSFEDESGSIELYGRVLVGASAPERQKMDLIRLRGGLKSILISEREPEVSIIREVSIRETGAEAWQVLAKNVRLNPQETLKLSLPDDTPDGTLLKIEGFYEILQ